jgi:hypothetical protein
MLAEQLKKLVEDEFGLEAYLAFRVQSLDDIMTITQELKSSDYFLFVDFLRRADNPEDLTVSLFTHQELALAHHLGFSEIIALQQEGAPLEGFIRYVLSNPERFATADDLIPKARELLQERNWHPGYSRNLTIEQLGWTDTMQYRDHTGAWLETVWQIRIHNHRPDVAAVGAVCILDSIEKPDGRKVAAADRSYLKWAGQSGYERTILPTDFGDIDLLSIHLDSPGIFLHSLRDTPREPVVRDNGNYVFHFKLFSQGFPLLGFSVNVRLSWAAPAPLKLDNATEATLNR